MQKITDLLTTDQVHKLQNAGFIVSNFFVCSENAGIDSSEANLPLAKTLISQKALKQLEKEANFYKKNPANSFGINTGYAYYAVIDASTSESEAFVQLLEAISKPK